MEGHFQMLELKMTKMVTVSLAKLEISLRLQVKSQNSTLELEQ